MKKPEYLKSMFDFVKGLGGMKEYSDFDDYNQRKFGIGKKETPEDDYQKFLNELGVDDKKQFDEMFN